MRSICLSLSALAACLTFAVGAQAQQVVHALSGTVVNVDDQGKTLQIKTNNGSEGLFTFSSSTATPVDFDREVQAHTSPISSFRKASDQQPEQVVVFYYGNGGERTVVAVQDLGSGPFDVVEGSVSKFDRHQHTLTLKTSAGKTQTFQMGPKAAADTMTGAVVGNKFSPSKGDNVRVIATKGSSTETALFIRD